jgi:hypothetical protein
MREVLSSDPLVEISKEGQEAGQRNLKMERVHFDTCAKSTTPFHMECSLLPSSRIKVDIFFHNLIIETRVVKKMLEDLDRILNLLGNGDTCVGEISQIGLRGVFRSVSSI